MSIDTPNLFAAGRTADGDRKAGASIRVMGTAFATGQAAGVAAAGYAQHGAVDASEVRKILLEQGAWRGARGFRLPSNSGSEQLTGAFLAIIAFKNISM